MPSVTPIGYEAAWPGAARAADWIWLRRMIQMQGRLDGARDLINFLRKRNGEQADDIVELKKEIRELKGRLRQYEHFNISGDTAYNAERDAWRKKALDAGSRSEDGAESPSGGKPGRRGAPMGHPGVSHHNKSRRSVTHSLEQCPKCGKENLKKMRPTVASVVDFIGNTMILAAETHVRERAVCLDCRCLVEADWPVISGTMFGEKALGFIVEYSGRKNVDEDIAGYFTNLYGFKVSSSAIWNARKAATRLLERTYAYIMDELKNARFIQMDESPFRIMGCRGYVWLARTDTATFMIMSLDRSMQNLFDHFSDLFLIPVTVDGYVAYPGRFMIIQRCWAHILREAEDLAMAADKGSLEEELHQRLRGIFHAAKRTAAGTAGSGGADTDTCMDLKMQVLAVASLYGKLPFAGTLRNAAPNLFTFLRYPGMPPTNNAAEGDIRDGVVLERKIRQKMTTKEGMHVFAVIHSFTQTCRKLRLVPWKQVVNIVRDRDWNIFDEARRQNAPMPAGFRPARALEYKPVPVPALEYKPVPVPALEYKPVPVPALEYKPVPVPALEYKPVPVPALEYKPVPVPALRRPTPSVTQSEGHVSHSPGRLRPSWNRIQLICLMLSILSASRADLKIFPDVDTGQAVPQVATTPSTRRRLVAPNASAGSGVPPPDTVDSSAVA